MPEFSFLWIFLTAAAVLDTAGLFYLWRRRSSPVPGHNRPLSTLDRWRKTKAERRRKERRQTGRAASA